MYSNAVRHGPVFYRLCSETPDSFRDMSTLLTPHFNQFDGITEDNVLLMVLIWLRQYPTYSLLSVMFGTTSTTVSRVIRSTIPILYHHLKSFIVWPSTLQWKSLQNSWEMFPYAVGCIDGTLHEINIPDHQQQRYYSGHRHFHALSSQVIVDVFGNIRFIYTGFEGGTNDAGQFLRLPPIGPGQQLDFPPDCFLLGDKGYANRYPVIAPFRQNNVRAAGVNAVGKKLYNTEHAKVRIIVEHTISYIKRYRAVKECYRHERFMQPIVTDVCAFLAQRQIELGINIRG